MTALAPILQAFFTDRLSHSTPGQRAHRRRLPGHLPAAADLRHRPHRQTALELDIADLDAPMIAAFLTHLETGRGNSVPTRNARLAAIHSLFGYAALRMPEHAGLIQRVLAIPTKSDGPNPESPSSPATKSDALLAAPDRNTRTGRRDHALLAGRHPNRAPRLRTHRPDLPGRMARHRPPTFDCDGKGRKQRCTPLTPATAKLLRAWTTERAGQPTEPLFCTRDGNRLSRDAVERLLRKHVATAATTSATLRGKRSHPTCCGTAPRWRSSRTGSTCP